jgi:hypothetical protein
MSFCRLFHHTTAVQARTYAMSRRSAPCGQRIAMAPGWRVGWTEQRSLDFARDDGIVSDSTQTACEAAGCPSLPGYSASRRSRLRGPPHSLSGVTRPLSPMRRRVDGLGPMPPAQQCIPPLRFAHNDVILVRGMRHIDVDALFRVTVRFVWACDGSIRFLGAVRRRSRLAGSQGCP